MKILLQTLVLLTFIASSCNQKIDTKTEIVNTLNQTKVDTVKLIEIDRLVIEKNLPDYITIQKPTITKSDYINFFNDVLNPDGLVINTNIEIFIMEPAHWNSHLIKLTEKSNDSAVSELIDKNDIKFIYEQTESQKKIVIVPKQISRKKVEKEYLDDLIEKVNLVTYWNEIYKLGSGYYSLELPLFSIDKTIAFFRYSYSCGSLCANSGTYIYKKINGKWEWIGNIGIEIVS